MWLHRHKEMQFKAAPEKQQRELGSLKKPHPKYVLRNFNLTRCWLKEGSLVRCVWGCIHSPLNIFHQTSRLPGVYPSNFSCFNNSTFLREGYSGETSAGPKACKDDAARFKLPADPPGPHSLPGGGPPTPSTLMQAPSSLLSSSLEASP